MQGSPKERPILFSGPMVRAILDGRKTQTRRVVKGVTRSCEKAIFDPAIGWRFQGGPNCDCPYGKPGDVLWVRETWGTGTRPCPFEGWVDGIEYRADDFDLDENEYLPLHTKLNAPDEFDFDAIQGWKPSIHMPKWACRLRLTIEDVRVERLQEISEGDAIAEGCSGGGWTPSYNDPDNCMGEETILPSDEFYKLWDSINDKREGATWLDNPWVWVVEFEANK